MGEATGFTAERMLEIEDSTVVGGEVVGDNLILTTRDGTDIIAGNVRGPEGDAAPPSGPAGGELAGNYPNPTIGILAAARVLTWGADTNIYRSAADILKTDDAFQAVQDVTARKGAANEVLIGTVAANPGILFGSAGDTNLYRFVANFLKTDDILASGLGVIGAYGTGSDTSIGLAGPSSQAGVKFGSAQDVNLYRSAADVLKTDDTFQVGAKLDANIAGDYFYSLFGYAEFAGGGGNKAAVRISSTTLNTGLTIGGDTNLYRSAADFLKTDDAFGTANDIYARLGGGTQIVIGAGGPGGVSGMTFGSANDTNLYRSAADTLKTDDSFQSAVDITAFVGGVGTQVKLTDAAGGAGKGGITFGTGGDVAIFRDSASVLKMANALWITNDFYARTGANETGVGNLGPTSQAAIRFVDATTRLYRGGSGQINIDGEVVLNSAKLYFGSAADTYLYRLLAGHLRTDNQFTQKRSGTGIATYGIVQGANGYYSYQINSDGKVEWGPGATDVDTNLYRASVDQLKTDDSFQVGGLLQGQNVKTLGAMYFGSLGDTALYRLSAATLATDNAFVAALGYSATQIAANNVLSNKLLAADANPAFQILGNGKIQWGAGGASAVDNNLYRGGPSDLRTDSSLSIMSQDLYVRESHAAKVVMGAHGPAGEAAIKFGSAADTNLYRSAADTLKTDDNFYTTQTLYAKQGAASQVGLGALGPSAEAGIALGSASDVKLYRYSSTILKTDAGFDAKNYRAFSNSGNAFYSANASGQQQFSISWNGIITFGSNDVMDTNLYRSAADTLKTDDTFVAPNIQLGEQGADPAAVADAGRLFTKDNGAGKTQLCVRFGTGAVQVIATEP